jgi:transposase
MLQISAADKVYFGKNSIDFRCGIESLMGYCANVLLKNPMCGGYFVFKNRKNTQLKILHYDGVGFYLCLRRFSKGKIAWWPEGGNDLVMQPRELLILLLGGNPQTSMLPSFWKKLD